MAFGKVALALGFLFVFGWTHAVFAERNPIVLHDGSLLYSASDSVRSESYRRYFPSTDIPMRRSSDENSVEYESTGGRGLSISYRKDFFSTDNPKRTTVSLPIKNFSKHASTNKPVPSVSYQKEFYSTSAPTGYTERYKTTGENTAYPYSSLRPDTVGPTGYTGRYTTPGEDTSYSYTSYGRDTARPTGYTGRYKTPQEDTAYPYTSPRPHTVGPTGYTGRYKTPGEDTAYPYTSPRPHTVGPTGYTGSGRYKTPGEDTAYPYTSPRPDTARPTGYTGKYKTPGEDTAYPSPKPDTRRPRTDYTTTIRYICNTSPDTAPPYDPTYNPTPSTSNTGHYSTPPPNTPTQAPRRTTRPWDPTGNCIIFDTLPPGSTWKRRTTPVMWETTAVRNTDTTRNTDSTWNTGTTPRQKPTSPRWWTGMPVTHYTPDSKHITKSKPNSGSDTVPGSLRNYFFIACEKCNVFSQISVKKYAQSALNPNRKVMFQNMIDNMETKIDAALQNIMASMKETSHFVPEEE